MTRDELQKVRNWADDQVGTGDEPSWLWYQHMKLRECLDAIIGGMEGTAVQWANRPAQPGATPIDDVIQWEDGCAVWHEPNGLPTYDPKTGLRLVVSNASQTGVQSQGQKSADVHAELEDSTVRLLRSAY
jgi:hypothetical protein